MGSWSTKRAICAFGPMDVDRTKIFAVLIREVKIYSGALIIRINNSKPWYRPVRSLLHKCALP